MAEWISTPVDLIIRRSRSQMDEIFHTSMEGSVEKFGYGWYEAHRAITTELMRLALPYDHWFIRAIAARVAWVIFNTLQKEGYLNEALPKLNRSDVGNTTGPVQGSEGHVDPGPAKD